MNDIKFMTEAYRRGSLFSTDLSTQNGCVLVDPAYEKVVAWGANHFPLGIKNLSERWERPLKYSYVEHAERNAIYNAACNGIKTSGLHMYCYWAACAECARAIIQSGITRLITHKIIMDATYDRWKDTIEIAFGMMREAGICLDQVEEPIDIEIRFNGKLWTPNGK
jgi:dCMP deaminase